MHHAPIVTSTTLYSQRNLSSTLYSQHNLKRTLCIQRNIKRTLSIQRNHNYTLCTVRVFLNLVRSPATPRCCAPGGSGLFIKQYIYEYMHFCGVQRVSVQDPASSPKI